MKSLDELRQKKLGIVQKMQDAIRDNDQKAYAAAVDDLMENIRDQVMAQLGDQQEAVDANVLASRGVRQLTSEERTYFQRVGEAIKSPNPKQALADLDLVMPKTEIDAVFKDLTTDHPLMEVLDFQNTSGQIELIFNTHEDQLGAWGPLTGEIVKELTSGFKKVSATLAKYSAFIPVAKSMLDLGPEWLERYVRTILSEAVYLGIEEAVLVGDGKDKPIGMTRKVGTGVTVVDGVYPEKEMVTVNDLGPLTYGGLLAKMATTENGHQRAIGEVFLVVSPVDYFSRIMPATTIRAADGKWTRDVFPFPTKVIQSVYMPQGKMILGIPKKYFMGVGTEKSGKLDSSDEYRFLEDERIYLMKLYGHGEPKDNNAFQYCDISGMEPAALEVKIVGSTAAGAAEAVNP